MILLSFDDMESLINACRALPNFQDVYDAHRKSVLTSTLQQYLLVRNIVRSFNSSQAFVKSRVELYSQYDSVEELMKALRLEGWICLPRTTQKTRHNRD